MENAERPHHLAQQQTLIAEAHEAICADDLPRAERLLDEAAKAGRIQRALLDSQS